MLFPIGNADLNARDRAKLSTAPRQVPLLTWYEVFGMGLESDIHVGGKYI